MKGESTVEQASRDGSGAVREPQAVVVSDMDAFTQRLNTIVQVHALRVACPVTLRRMTPLTHLSSLTYAAWRKSVDVIAYAVTVAWLVGRPNELRSEPVPH